MSSVDNALARWMRTSLSGLVEGSPAPLRMAVFEGLAQCPGRRRHVPIEEGEPGEAQGDVLMCARPRVAVEHRRKRSAGATGVSLGGLQHAESERPLVPLG